MKNRIKISLLLLSIFISICSFENTHAQSGWYQINSPSNTALMGIYFKNSNTGIINGFKTTNGGQTWVDNRPGNIFGLSFPDTAIGYCFTGTNIYKTVNLGDNWLPQQIPVPGLNSIYFINVNTGYACGPGYNVIETTNGGVNWLTVNFPYNYYNTNIFFVNAATGYVIGFNDTSFIIKTTNGGQNWNIKYFTGQQFYSIFFINPSTGFVGGTNIFRTTDSGVSWNQYSYNSQPIFSLFFSNDNTGYSCGSNGTVLKTTNGGGPPIGIKQIGKEVPKSFSLSQNYPNPFNPSTKIKFSLPHPSKGGESKVELIIYDVIGNEIAILVNENLQSGVYEIEWNATNFSTGIYFYRLITSEFTEYTG